jgi:hypothetical protein
MNYSLVLKYTNLGEVFCEIQAMNWTNNRFSFSPTIYNVLRLSPHLEQQWVSEQSMQEVR